MKQFIPAALAAVLLLSGMGMTASAEAHYDVYNYDRWAEPIPSQAGYAAIRSVSGSDLGVGDFSGPRDIFRDAQDRFLIADTKNHRIVITDADLTKAEVLETFTMPDGSVTTLNTPQGIYVSPETELIYIADYNNARVLVCTYDGAVQMEITKPDSELFAQELTFLPQKVLADKAGNVYVVLGNITIGAAMFDANGEFRSYYGANTVQTTPEVLAEHFWKMISTEEMRSRQARSVPSGITSFDLDDEGFIYTCTQSTSQTKDTVKKLNPAGTNLFADMDTVWGDHQSVYDTNTSREYKPQICDIDISDDGSINCLDMTTGRVFQYDKEGELLFIFGSLSDQLGGFWETAALESYDNQILVLDSRKNTLTVFEETDFGAAVHEATVLYNGGYYEEALEPWYDVLQYDGNYRRAFLGISAALMVQGDYKGSMEYAKLADSSYRYNKAFEGYRQEWLSAHLNEVTAGVIVLAAGCFVFRRYRKKRPKTNAGEEDDSV